MRETFSLIAGILLVCGYVPYIRAILKGTTKPAKASWAIWACLDTVALYGMYLQNSVNGQIVGATLGAIVVAMLSIKYGKPGWTKLDEYCLAGAVIGISLIFLSPRWSLLASLATIFVGSFPTFRSAWNDPRLENKLAWTLGWFSCVFAICAVPKWTVQDAAQPMTFFAIQTVMMYLLYCRQIKVRV